MGSDGHTCSCVVFTKLGDTIPQDPVGALLGHVPLTRFMFELQVICRVGCVLAGIMGPNVAGDLSDLRIILVAGTIYLGAVFGE